MNFKINFQKAKRNYMQLTFDDVDENGNDIETVLSVGMPKKRIYGIMLELKAVLTTETKNEADETAAQQKQIEDLYMLVAEILSNNLQRKKISVEWVDDQMTTEEIKLFLREYVKFCKGEASSPN